MSWKHLTSEAELEAIKAASAAKPQVIFKHSTRCSVSTMAKSRLEKQPFPAAVDFHYLDLISYRAISNKVAEDFKVWHESPQVLVIKNGECVFDESHMGIYMDEILEHAA